jgi:AraC-like DNA-binding protein
MTFQEYVNSVRFNCACKLIAGEDRKMLDVCIESGFSDYRYFCAAFKKRLGTTPDLFRLTNSRGDGGAGGSANRFSEEEIHGKAESEAYLAMLRKLV